MTPKKTVAEGLVYATIERLQKTGPKVRGIGGPAKKAQPLAPKILEGLRLPSGEPLPASLLAWLAYDTRILDPVDENGSLKTTTLRAFVREVIGDLFKGLEQAFDAEAVISGILGTQPFPDAPALQLPDNGSQMHFLVFDGSLEPAVLGYEKEELWVKYASFGEFAEKWFRS